MLIFNWKETTQKILKEIWSYNYNNEVDLLVNGISISILGSLKSEPDNSELWLFKFWNDPRSFISFKEKIKYSIHNWISVYFDHIASEDWIEDWLLNIDKVINWWWKVIVQLPINNESIIEKIKSFPIIADIDNLQWDIDRYWCTQSAIIWLANYIINRKNINNILVIWYKWFIWKWIQKWLSVSYPSINILWIDKVDNLSEEEEFDKISDADLIISTASSLISFPDNIKKGVSIIDCWLIRWNLWIRGSIPMWQKFIKNYNITTPVPWWIWPFEMLYMISKLKNISPTEMDILIDKNVVLSNFNI